MHNLDNTKYTATKQTRVYIIISYTSGAGTIFGQGGTRPRTPKSGTSK